MCLIHVSNMSSYYQCSISTDILNRPFAVHQPEAVKHSTVIWHHLCHTHIWQLLVCLYLTVCSSINTEPRTNSQFQPITLPTWWNHSGTNNIHMWQLAPVWLIEIRNKLFSFSSAELLHKCLKKQHVIWCVSMGGCFLSHWRPLEEEKLSVISRHHLLYCNFWQSQCCFVFLF